MTQDTFEARYDVTNKSKIKIFFVKHKIVIYSLLILLITSFFSLFIYLDYKKDKKMLLADNYVKAKVYLENRENKKAINILNELINSNDSVYSSLAFFLIINENLITDQNKLSELFEVVLEKNNLNEDIKYLIILKKAIFKSNFASETELLADINPIIKSDNVWKPHALLLMGDYYLSKKEYIKSIDFYNQILTMKNIHQDFYYKANSRLTFVSNEK